MTAPSYRTAFIVGAGTGLSASLARLLHAQGLNVALGARDIAKLESLASETRALTVAVNAVDEASVAAAFTAVEARFGAPDVVIYNASGRLRGPFVDLEASAVEQ